MVDNLVLLKPCPFSDYMGLCTNHSVYSSRLNGRTVNTIYWGCVVLYYRHITCSDSGKVPKEPAPTH